MMQKRRQLTLFIEEKASASIEKVRQAFNPEQFALIMAHVTLCREDELQQIDKVMLHLAKLNVGSISIDFADVIRFSDGKGVLIPATADNLPFQQLREKILEGIIDKPRHHQPHITLMHPRNATCTDAIFEEIQKISFPKKIQFGKISLIEQETGQQWSILEEFFMKKNNM